jgi:hypothetical protein
LTDHPLFAPFQLLGLRHASADERRTNSAHSTPRGSADNPPRGLADNSPRGLPDTRGLADNLPRYTPRGRENPPPAASPRPLTTAYRLPLAPPRYSPRCPTGSAGALPPFPTASPWEPAAASGVHLLSTSSLMDRSPRSIEPLPPTNYHWHSIPQGSVAFPPNEHQDQRTAHSDIHLVVPESRHSSPRGSAQYLPAYPKSSPRKSGASPPSLRCNFLV